MTVKVLFFLLVITFNPQGDQLVIQHPTLERCEFQRQQVKDLTHVRSAVCIKEERDNPSDELG